MIILALPSLAMAAGLFFSAVSVILGLLVAYLAVRGYVQSGQRPMLFIAVGFVLVLLTPLLSLSGFMIASIDEVFFYIAAAFSQTVGLVSILYGLKMPRKASKFDDV